MKTILKSVCIAFYIVIAGAFWFKAIVSGVLVSAEIWQNSFPAMVNAVICYALSALATGNAIAAGYTLFHCDKIETVAITKSMGFATISTVASVIAMAIVPGIQSLAFLAICIPFATAFLSIIASTGVLVLGSWLFIEANFKKAPIRKFV